MTQNRSQKCHTFVPKGDTKMVSKVTQFHSEEVKKNATKTTEISPGDEGEKCSRIVTHIPVSNGTITNGNVCHDSGALFPFISRRNFVDFGWIFSLQKWGKFRPKR